MDGDGYGGVGAGKTGAVTFAMRGFLAPARNRRPNITAAVVGVALRANMKSCDSAGSGSTLVKVGDGGGRR